MEFEGTRPAIPAAIAASGVVAIGRRLEAGSVAGIAEALLAGGVRAFELTLSARPSCGGCVARASTGAGSASMPRRPLDC